jgi:putative DNA primase/helicase
MCRGNSRLILAVSAAFAGPLLTPLGMEGGGLHFIGRSSLGKSTALEVAGSVLGGGGKHGFVRMWKTTMAALESICEAHNDLMLPLDEISLLSPYDAINAIYTIANGQARARSSKTLQPRSLATWRLMLLSSGEKTLAQLAAEINQQVQGGAAVRLPSVPADAACGLGLFEDIHSTGSAKNFAIQLHDAALKYYGTPFRAFLERLMRDRASVESRWSSFRDGFRREYVPEKAGEEVGRVAERFALIAYAGTLATEWGITGWREDEADRSVGTCFAASLHHRGCLGASDVELGVRQVKGILERYGSSRFEGVVINTDGSPRIVGERIQERYGFRKDGKDGSTDYLILPEVFKSVVCKGFDAEAIAQELARKGHLRRDGKHLTVKHTIPGMNRPRLYTINSSLFTGESQAAASDPSD